MATAPVKVSIQSPDGYRPDIHVEPGSTVSEILGHEALTMPAGFCGRLVTESAELLEPDSRVCEPQVRESQKYTHLLSILSKEPPYALCLYSPCSP